MDIERVANQKEAMIMNVQAPEHNGRSNQMIHGVQARDQDRFNQRGTNEGWMYHGSRKIMNDQEKAGERKTRKESVNMEHDEHDVVVKMEP